MCMKILHKETVIRLKQQEHCKNEKEILMAAKHPFIVNLYVICKAIRYQRLPVLTIDFCVVLGTLLFRMN